VKVLVVDGSALIRARLSAELEARAIEVVEAAFMAQALILAQATAFDAVLLDVHLDEDAGVIGLSRLRMVAPYAIIVVLTNEANEVHRRECIKHGADFFLDKSKDFLHAVDLVWRRR
jgi:DNA-binding response OmpR family regulator